MFEGGSVQRGSIVGTRRRVNVLYFYTPMSKFSHLDSSNHRALPAAPPINYPKIHRYAAQSRESTSQATKQGTERPSIHPSLPPPLPCDPPPLPLTTSIIITILLHCYDPFFTITTNNRNNTITIRILHHRHHHHYTASQMSNTWTNISVSCSSFRQCLFLIHLQHSSPFLSFTFSLAAQLLIHLGTVYI